MKCEDFNECEKCPVQEQCDKIHWQIVDTMDTHIQNALIEAYTKGKENGRREAKDAFYEWVVEQLKEGEQE